ncbi:MAG: hypothetical protein JNM91_02945 [Flavobacteriales bacterium]|nr:hypothetical protein [Flavobacteriales bacterium]
MIQKNSAMKSLGAFDDFAEHKGDHMTNTKVVKLNDSKIRLGGHVEVGNVKAGGDPERDLNQEY